MGRVKRRFFLWLGDRICEAADERGALRRRAAVSAMLRPAGQKWFQSDVVWVNTVKDERFP